MALTAASWCTFLCALSLIWRLVAERGHVQAGHHSLSSDTMRKTATWKSKSDVRGFFNEFPSSESKQEKYNWLETEMNRVENIDNLNALHEYFSQTGDEGLVGGPYANMDENNLARDVVHLALKKYNGTDWQNVMNDEKLTAEPKEESRQFAGATASLIHQVQPPHEKFVILLLAWMPMGKYPKISMGGVGVAHTHGQAACSFKFLKAVQDCGNTFYDITGTMSDGSGTKSAVPNYNTFTDAKIFDDGEKHTGSCYDPNYKPILVNPKMGRQYIESHQILGENVAYIQDELGAHSIDNLNTEEIAYSIHIYYPPYEAAWAFHQHHQNPAHGCERDHTQSCEARLDEQDHPAQGWKNCEHPHGGECRTTNMKAYLADAYKLKTSSMSQVADEGEDNMGTVTKAVGGDKTLEPDAECTPKSM